MALSRAALDAAGPFDAETFRPGYGEEVDWGMRAGALGFRNVLVPNLFVYHKHGATFRRETSFDNQKLKADHDAVLQARYPDLLDRQHAFTDSAGYQSLRAYLTLLAAAETGEGLEVAFTTHDRVAARNTGAGDDRPRLLIGAHAETGEYLLSLRHGGRRAGFSSPDFNWVIKLLHRLRLREIAVEELPPADAPRLIRALERMRERVGVAVRFAGGEKP
jgi:hypothetical protein